MTAPSFFAAGEAIEARLRAALATTILVKPAASLRALVAAKPQGDAVYLYYDGYRTGDAVRTAGAARIDQVWVAVVAAKSLRDVASGAGVREEAGPIADAVLGALLGWQPSPAHAALALTAVSGGGLQLITGLGLLPLAFTTSYTAKGTT